MNVQLKKASLPPYLNTWFLACQSTELKAGEILSKTFCGEEVILFRNKDRKPVMMGAYCPHLGAHMGKGGVIKEDLVVCPFHGFSFDGEGKCVKTGYGSKPPPQARVRTWPTIEQNGVVFAYNHDKGEAPDWVIPALDEKGWTPLMFHNWTLESHPQEIAENSVDIGHFSLVHGYEDVLEVRPIVTEGPKLNGVYGMSRKSPMPGSKARIKAVFEATQWGVGYALAVATVEQFGLTSRHLVFPTSIDGVNISLTIATSFKKDVKFSKINPVLGLLPRGLSTWILRQAYFKNYIADVYDDFMVWKNKVYVHPPALAKGDGPIIIYRKWASQFHPQSQKKTQESVV